MIGFGFEAFLNATPFGEHMTTHLAWTDDDTYSFNLILTEWARKGFEGELDVNHMDSGFVSITTQNWISGNAPFVQFELHKLRGKGGWFGRQKAKWLVRLYSCESYDGAFAGMHGCVDGWSMLAALDRAMLDVGYGFRSQSVLEDYFEK